MQRLMFLTKIMTVWGLLMVAESIHGTLRVLLLIPKIGELRAKQVSFFTGSALILVITYLLIPWIQAKTTRSLVATGVSWVILTFIFEISISRLVLKYSWDKILVDYNLSQGGLMPLGLLILVVAPWMMAKLRRIA